MPRPARVRAQDLRVIYRLVGECRELGDDPAVWRRHLIARLASLTGAEFGVAGDLGVCDGSPRRDLGIADWGWSNGFNRDGWLEMLRVFQHNPLYNPLMNAYIDRMRPEGGVCLGRTEMIPDHDWYRSDYFRSLHRVIGVDATLVCFRAVPGTADEFSEIYLARRMGERDFSARDRAMVLEAHVEIAPLVGRSLARFSDPRPSALAPRVRQVLKCLLEGDSDKQVAARLGISRYTVNQYVKVIFQHFGVESRPELLARWIKRGWGARCAWLDDV